MADDKPPEKPAFDPFKPAEPRLPGVPEKKAAKPAAPPTTGGAAPTAAPASGASAEPAAVPAWMEKLPPQLRALPPAALYGGAGAVVLVLVILVWLVFRSPEPPPAPPQQTTSAPSAAVPSGASAGEAGQPAEPTPEVVTLPATVATTKDLAKAWSYRKFIIRQSGERIPAMVLRLPGSAGNSSAYWGFSLRAPFGRCELELITDTQKLANEYGYNVSHPMVADPCTQTLFHPLRMGSIGPSTYTRGEVVQGTALRPPIAVEIRIQKGEVIAFRTE